MRIALVQHALLCALRQHVASALRSALVASALFAAGCSGAGEPAGDGKSSNAAGGAASSALIGLSEAGSSDTTCAAIEETAEVSYRPIDVIFVVDNSASMDDKISAVEARINQDFARIIAASGLDYRVIMVSRYGKVGEAVGASSNPICIAPPLGGSSCDDPEHTQLVNGQRFFHYSADVESHDALCVLLGGFNHPDEYGDTPRPGWQPLAPLGFSQYLRPEAFKTFVVISDDEVHCNFGGQTFDDMSTVSGGETAAESFDAALLKLSPSQFGTAAKRNYVWHSIVGVSPLSTTSSARPPTAAISTQRCAPGSQGPGTGYQALSRLTGGISYPSCDHSSFNAVFNTIAAGVVQGAAIACEWQIPDAPSGMRFDSGRVNVRYTSGTGNTLQIPAVSGRAACGPRGGWYYDDPQHAANVSLCASTCANVNQDSAARIDVAFGCETEVLTR